MNRREREPDDPYYQHEHFIGEVPIQGRPTGLHLRIHTQDEPYRGRHEIYPVSAPRGTRTYIHAKPYVLEPDIRLTVGLYQRPDPTGAVGRVIGSEQRNWRRREIGQAQAWHYPQDRTVVLWECYQHDWLRTSDDPAQDPLHVATWQGFERWLLKHLQPVERIVTTWEDIYDRPIWQAFLASQGFTPYGPEYPAAFVKQIRTPGE
jgi:hypothetical protein